MFDVLSSNPLCLTNIFLGLHYFLLVIVLYKEADTADPPACSVALNFLLAIFLYGEADVADPLAYSIPLNFLLAKFLCREADMTDPPACSVPLNFLLAILVYVFQKTIDL